MTPTARSSCVARGRGFSLIEMLVALSLTAMVVALALGVYVRSRDVDRVRALRSEMIREGTFASTILTNTLRRAGVGIPRGPFIDSGATPIEFASAIIWGEDDIVGIVADVERPHVQYASLGHLHGKAPVTAATARTHLAWHTENNGNCITAGACTLAASSVFFPGEVGCNTAGTGAFNDRTCAWGLKRMEAGDHFIIASGSGDWTTAVFNASSGLVLDGGTLYVELDVPYTDAAPVDWPNTNDTPPMEITGTGFVSTPDRVFFRFAGAAAPYTLQRKQCWGEAAPNDADWPSNTAGTFPTALQSGPPNQACEPAGDAAWETLLRNIESFDFSYYDDTGAALGRPLSSAGRIAARRVDYRFTLSLTDAPTGRVVRQDIVGSAAVRNIP